MGCIKAVTQADDDSLAITITAKVCALLRVRRGPRPEIFRLSPAVPKCLIVC